MLYTRYKQTHIYIFRDDENGLWYARDIENQKWSNCYMTLDKLKNALKEKLVNWMDILEHFHDMKMMIAS